MQRKADAKTIWLFPSKKRYLDGSVKSVIIFSDLAKFFMISLTSPEARKFLCNSSFSRLVDTLLMSVGMLD